MKQFRLFFLAVILLAGMGMGMTSCVDGETHNTVVGSAFVKVHTVGGLTYFVDLNGIKYTPDANSLTDVVTNQTNPKFTPSKTNMAVIYFTYDSSEQNIESKSISVKLTFAKSLDIPLEIVNKRGDTNDSTDVAPIIAMKGSMGGYTYQPYMFDSTTLMLTINYFMYSPLHSFTLVYYPNDPTTDNKTVKLYLRHNNEKDATVMYTSQEYRDTYPYAFFKACDITRLMSTLNNKSLVIVTKENATDLSMSNAKEMTYSVSSASK